MSETSERVAPPQFIEEYRRHVESLPTGEYRWSADNDQEYELSAYSNIGYRSAYGHTDAAIAQPFPAGFMRPSYADTVEGLMGYATSDTTVRHKYEMARHPDMQGGDWQHFSKRDASRPMERFYAAYIRRRSEFHLAFLESVAGVAEQLPQEAFDRINEKELVVASRSPLETAAEKIFSYPEWATFSLLNILYADPSTLSVGFQQKALRLFAQSVDAAELGSLNPSSLYSIGSHDKATVVGQRLPTSFLRTHAEISATTHPKWRENKVIKELFGEQYAPKPFDAGINQLLVEKPEDLMQVLLINLAHGNRLETLRVLHVIGQLPDQILDVVMSQDASYRLVHGEAHTRYGAKVRELGMTALSEESDDPKALRALLAAALARIAYANADIAALGVAIEALQVKIDTRDQQLAAMQRREAMQPLFALHGIHPDASDEITSQLLSSLRRFYARRYHPTQGTEPDEEKLKTYNSQLDQIARSKGLTNTDEALGVSDVDQ